MTVEMQRSVSGVQAFKISDDKLIYYNEITVPPINLSNLLPALFQRCKINFEQFKCVLYK